MKIGVDARILERPMTGVGRYLSNLLKHLPEIDSENEYILLSYRPLQVSIKGIKNIGTLSVAPKGILQKLVSPFWLNCILPSVLKREKIDIFFSPNNILPIRKTNTKNIVTIHDVFQLIDPKFHSPIYRSYVSFVMNQSIKSADLVLTISESSKRDIVRLLHVPEEKVVVTYLAADERFMPRMISPIDHAHYSKKYNFPEKFILYVGVIEKRKNIDGIIRIADELRNKTDVSIVLVGRPGYGGNELIEEIKKRKNMHYIGFADDDDLPYLYNLAEIFLFPSHYEGFGLPPLEAMQSGVPVVASNTSSLPEVIGDAGILLDPKESKLFAKAIISIINDENKRQLMINRGVLQAKKFDYRKTVEITARAINSLK